MAEQDYREKIKKLLALSESSNEHEAKSALLKAKKLMAEHKIAEIDLEDIGKKKVVHIKTEFDCSKRRELTDEFDRENDYAWQAHFNGRSGGYLVLYSGGLKDTGYKSFCTSCGQRNFRTVEESGCTCGRCRKDTRVNYKHPLMQKYASGRSVDENEDFEEWSIEELRERCRVVERFDILCDSIVEEAARLSESVETVEETVYVPTKRKVLKEVAIC